MIHTLILAGGNSARMGTPKALLDYNGKTFAEAVCDSVEKAGINRITLVAGVHAEEITDTLSGRANCHIVVNPNPDEGMISSVRTGLRAVGDVSEAVIISLVDQPFIPSCIYHELVRTWMMSNADVVIPRYNGKRGHPILLAKKVWPLCFTGPADLGLHWVTHHPSVKALDVDVECEFVVKDVDTPADYRSLVEAFRD